MEPTAIVYISAEAIVGLVTTIGNCLVLAVIIRTPQLHTVTNVFVGNLAIADIAVGVLVAPCAALSFLGLPHNFYGCIFINCLIIVFTNVSILMLMSVAIERFIAIKEPFVYQRILTVRRAIYVNFLVWILGCILGLVPMYGWHRGYQIVTYCRFTEMISYEYMVYFQFFGLVLLPLFIMLCIYIYILLIVRKHTRQTNALVNQFRQSKDAKDGFNKDVKAAKIFALVILLFGIFWIPVNLFNCISLFCGANCPFALEGLLVAIVMSHANSSINPFLYAASNSRIKRGLKELFRIKLSPQDTNNTDYHKHRTSNGLSYARDNSVAPISNVDETSHKQDDKVRVFTVSSKTFPPNGRISVQPADNHHNVKPAVSDSDNQQSQLQSHSNNTSYSTVSQHSSQDGEPDTQSSQHNREQSLTTPREMNKPLTVSSVPQDSQNQLHDLECDDAIPNGHPALGHGNSESTTVGKEDNLHQTIRVNSDSKDSPDLSKYNMAERRKSGSLFEKSMRNIHWTTSASGDDQQGSVSEMKGNNYEKRNPTSTNDIDNNAETNHYNQKNDASIMSSILVDEFGKQRKFEAEHTKF